MKTAVFSVVYPGIENFFHEFISSLKQQTDNNFVLFIVNDGMASFENFLQGVNFDVRLHTGKGSPSDIRKQGIRWVAAEGMQTIIFADSDDFFETNRVEISKKVLEMYDIVVNELELVGENIKNSKLMFDRIFKNKTEVSTKDIVGGNCLGMSNTALRIKIIPAQLDLIPSHLIAFDWTFYALCMHGGARTVFTNETKTYYRQHGNNIASPECFSDKQIMRGLGVKKEHYQFLAQFYQEYASLSNQFEKLCFQLEKDDRLKQEYCEGIRAKFSEMDLWWKPIKSLEELSV